MDLHTLIGFLKTNSPALVAGVIGGMLIEPFKAWFMEPLKAKALLRQRVRAMRSDLYRSLARDISLLNRLRLISELKDGTPDMAAFKSDPFLMGSTLTELMAKMMSGQLLEDFHTETYDDWRRAYPTEYHLLMEADHIRDFYRRLKTAVDFGLTSAPVLERVDKYLYAYSWVLGHVRTGNLDEKLLREKMKEVEVEFAKRKVSMTEDIGRIMKP